MTDRDVLAALAPPASPSRDHADYKLGWWLAGALEDPNVCAEMKDVINKWFEAHQPGLIMSASSVPPASPLRGRESVREIAHKHCTCTCRGDPEVLQNHTNLCDEISDAILEYAVLSSAAPERPAALSLAVRLRDESGPPLPQMIAQRRAQLSQEQPAATPDIVKMYSDMERAKNARIGELEEALGKAVLSAPPVRQLTENERLAIAYAKYQCDGSSPSDPEVRFDYELIQTLLSLIPFRAALTSTDGGVK